MKKTIKVSLIFLGLVALIVTTSFVTALVVTEITNKQWIDRFPDSPFVEAWEICEGDIECVKDRGRRSDRVELATTEFMGHQIWAYYWYE